MSRKRTGITLAPKRGGLKKLLWGLAFVAVLVWIVKNPYQARDGLDHVVHAARVLFGGGA